MRTADTIKLIQYAYENFEIINIKEIVDRKLEQWLDVNQGRIYVNKGIKNNVELLLDELDFKTMAVKKTDVDKVEIEVNSIFYLEAPVSKNQVIGNAKVTLNGEVIDILQMCAKEEIRKKKMQDYLVEFMLLIKSITG